MEKLDTSTFKDMLWKNGRGLTTELYTIGIPFVFRISIATISEDGAFSLFPFMDRTLLLLEGSGISLSISNKQTQLTKLFKLIHFSGDEKVNCDLNSEPCRDFNIMIDRRWGSCNTTLIERNHPVTITASQDLTFIYDHSLNFLWKLDNNESIVFTTNIDIPLILIKINPK